MKVIIMKPFILFLTTYLLLFSSPVSSAEVLSRTLIDGKKVILFSDNTWKYDETPEKHSETCVKLSKRVDFCDKIKKWRRGSTSEQNQIAYYKFEDRYHGLIIEEDLGISDGLNFTFVRNAIIENAADAIDGVEDDVTVISVKDVELQGLAGNSVVYQLEYNGTPLIFMNTILLDTNTTLQLVTYSFAKTFEVFQVELHKKFLDAIKIH